MRAVGAAAVGAACAFAFAFALAGSRPADAQGLSPVLQRAEGVPTAQAPPQGSPLPGIRPPSLPQVSAPLAAPAPSAPAGASAATYSITDAQVDGSTAYTQAQLAPALSGLTGPAVPQSAVEDARVKLVNMYRADGYVYTVVNAVIDGPHLRLQVIEGRIVAVKLDGDIGPAGTQVLGFLNHLTQDGPLNAADLERWLLLASDVPGVTVRSVLNPSETEPGALTLVAQVSRSWYSGEFRSDNRAFDQTGPEEALLVLDANSFTEFGERTEVSLYRTYNATDTFGQASVEGFVGDSGLRFKIYGGAGEANPSGDLRAIGYDGVTRVFGGQLSYPLIRQRAQTLNLVANFDALESDISETGGGETSARASFDSLRVLRGGADYALLDTWLGDGLAASDALTFRLSQGLPALGATPNGDTQAPRVGEQTDFTKFGGQISRVQPVFRPWADAAVNLKAVLAGQWTNNILPPAEKFYLGGSDLDRGYYYGQVTGDRALAATGEVQLAVPLPVPDWSPSWVTEASVTFYGFYDWGETWNNNQDPDAHLRSAGGGARMYLSQWAELDLEGVARLTRRPLGAQEVSSLPGSALYWAAVVHF